MTTSDAPAGTLLTDLAKVGETLVSSDVPAATDIAHVVGALIKTLEATGTTVPDEVKSPSEPEPATAAPASSQPAVPAGPDPETENRISEVESKLDKILEALGDR